MSSAPPLPDGIVAGSDRIHRCWWGAEPPIYQAYHDDEWGRPVTDDCRLFELLVLEGAQVTGSCVCAGRAGRGAASSC